VKFRVHSHVRAVDEVFVDVSHDSVDVVAFVEEAEALCYLSSDWSAHFLQILSSDEKALR